MPHSYGSSFTLLYREGAIARRTQHAHGKRQGNEEEDQNRMYASSMGTRPGRRDRAVRPCRRAAGFGRPETVWVITLRRRPVNKSPNGRSAPSL